jgi:hypothetical protein
LPISEASIEELKEFASLVQNGRLFDVQAWLENGKPFRTTARTRANPISESVRIGFHSIVEVFLAAGLSPAERSAVLAEAVRARREGLVELLMEHGADVRAGQQMFLIDTE